MAYNHCAQQRGPTLHDAEDSSPRVLLGSSWNYTASGENRGWSEMDGVETILQNSLVGRSQTQHFLVYHPEMGLFSEYRKIHFSKEGIQHAQNMMQNVENMTKHWSSLDLWFCIALFQRNLPYQPSASWRGTSCSISGLGDRILPTIEKISMLISVSFEPLAGSGAFYLRPLNLQVQQYFVSNWHW